MSLSRFLYSCLLYLLIPLVCLRLLWRSVRAPAYRARWYERFAWYVGIQKPMQSPIWIHAVSVGETQAALPLINTLLTDYPDTPILVTTTTPTGSQRVHDALGDKVIHVYLPYDLPDAVARFLQYMRPKLSIILETELWANLFAACHQRRIPIIIANARLSARSARGYKKIDTLIKETLNYTTVIAAQAELDAQRFINLGTSIDKVLTTGNIKFDLHINIDELNDKKLIWREAWGVQRFILLAASTHEGEEAQLLNIYKILKLQLPDLLLVLVPRHPERFNQVAELCKAENLHCTRRSEKIPCTEETDIFLADSIGELMQFYSATDIAFVGGSLVPVGGHNPLEPAVLGIPVLFAAHIFNFTAVYQILVEADGARCVSTQQEFIDTISALYHDKALRQQLGKNGKQCVLSNQGALTQLLTIVNKHNS